jgi:hypothetical protein
LILEQGFLLGVLCRCDLVPRAAADEPVSARMSGEVLAIDPNATLGDAVAALRGFRVGCLPVVAGDLLVGVITRGDLRRAGVPEELLGARYCAACGSPHGVRAHPRLEGVDFCLACLDVNARFALGVAE